jgi:1,5-anhydro-D-fructose reductase (1,5-anhydro-D-mannitol-forming)
MAKKTIGWAIVGASSIARQWVADAIRVQPDSKLVAVVSRDRVRGEQFAGEFDIASVYLTVEEAAADPRVDAVYVCTSNGRHPAATLAAAARGKHVLCEKPLALTLDAGVEMVEACRRAGVVMGTNHHMRAAATHIAIRDLVARGKIGRPLAARALYAEFLPEALQGWRVDDPQSGGVIFDLTVHNVDALRFVLGEDPVEVMSMKASSLLGRNEVEDQTQSVMRFASGLIAYTHEGYVFAHHETGLEVHGTEGSIYGRGIMDERPVGRVLLRRGIDETEIPVVHRNLYEGTIRRFNDAIRGDGSPTATGVDGLKSLAAALAVKHSTISRKLEQIVMI